MRLAGWFRSRRAWAGPTSSRELVGHIIDNTYLNGEVIRLDGAIRMAAK